MPNIWLVGYEPLRARRVKGRIAELFSDRPYVRDIVITTLPNSSVTSLAGDHSPYVAVWLTPPPRVRWWDLPQKRAAKRRQIAQYQDVINLSRDLGQNLEVVHLAAFHEGVHEEE